MNENKRAALRALDEAYVAPDVIEPSPKRCILCHRNLLPVFEEDGWKHMQPYGGCEVQIIGSFGSTKFDQSMGSTVYRGVICDGCAEGIVHLMEGPNVTDMLGEPFQA